MIGAALRLGRPQLPGLRGWVEDLDLALVVGVFEELRVGAVADAAADVELRAVGEENLVGVRTPDVQRRRSLRIAFSDIIVCLTFFS